MGAPDIETRKPTPAELERRFLELVDDPRFTELGPWELNDYGEVVVSPVSGEHGRAQVQLASELERQLGGRGWIEQAIRRVDGPPFVPDVLWADRPFYEEHKARGMLPRAPRICVEIASESNPIERLREKCAVYLELGAEEAWIVDPVSKRVEFYGPQGRLTETGSKVDLAPFWGRL